MVVFQLLCIFNKTSWPCSYDLGLIGGALFNIRDEFHLSKAAEEWVVGLAKVGAFFGTFLGGAMMLHYGRRKTIAIDSIFYMAGPVVMVASYNVTYAAALKCLPCALPDLLSCLNAFATSQH